MLYHFAVVSTLIVFADYSFVAASEEVRAFILRDLEREHDLLWPLIPLA